MLPRCLAWSVLSIFVDFVKLPLCQFNRLHCCPRNALCLARLFCFFPNAERRVLVFLVGGLGGALFAACCVSRGSNQPLAVPIGIATKRDVVEVAKLHFVWQVWDEVALRRGVSRGSLIDLLAVSLGCATRVWGVKCGVWSVKCCV